MSLIIWVICKYFILLDLMKRKVSMKKILILMGRYLPGYKDGGPVRTIINCTDLLGDEYEFNILTSDRDHGDRMPYDGVKVNDWNKVEKANVFYVSNGIFKFKTIINLSKNMDSIYCCGPYDFYAIKLLILKKLHIIKKPVVIASMGSFSAGALQLKSKKKKIFLSVLKKLKLFEKIIWSVTSELEKRDLQDVLGKNVKCIVAEDLPRNTVEKHIRKKEKNKIKIIFLSRICRMKNLILAIDILKNIGEIEIQFDIYGNKEEIGYWDECETKLKALPFNVAWKYCGECDSKNVPYVFANYDIFLFPTLGENFGHVISESLLGGCLPIISDMTPWQDLDKYNCGNVIPIDDTDKFVSAIKNYAEMDNNEFCKYVINAQNYILNRNKKSIAETGYRKVFDL